MGIINKHLAKMSEGRTEITTKMIVEAEAAEFDEKVYAQIECNKYLIEISKAQQGYYPYNYMGGLFGLCPYCGK